MLTDFYDTLWQHAPAPDFDFQAEIFRVMFPDFENKVAEQVPEHAVILDIGCGPALAGLTYFAEVLPRIRAYHCVDQSGIALDQADFNLSKKQVPHSLWQGDLHELPFADGCADVVFCPGVLHYQADMQRTIAVLSKKLKIGGYLITWIYTKQKPIRQLTDAYLRSVFSTLEGDAAMEAIAPLTALGVALGKTGAVLDLPDIPCLGVKAGKYDLQRFFYYHIIKLFYSPRQSAQQHMINNLNAFGPAQVQFLEASQIMQMFVEEGYDLETANVQGNGIAIVARRTGLSEQQAVLSC